MKSAGQAIAGQDPTAGQDRLLKTAFRLENYHIACPLLRDSSRELADCLAILQTVRRHCCVAKY